MTTPVPFTWLLQARVVTRAVPSTAPPAMRSRLRVGRACRPRAGAPARAPRTRPAVRRRRGRRRSRRRPPSAGAGSGRRPAPRPTGSAARPRVGNGPAASRPPASQTMRIAWTAPRIPPAARSIVERTPRPSRPAAIAPDARAEGLADRDGRQHRPEDGDAPAGPAPACPWRRPDGGEGEDQEEAADRAGDAADLGQCAGPDPREDRGDQDDHREHIEQVHPRSIGRRHKPAAGHRRSCASARR